jgi:glycosyltransferase involved in cell wall biosynthesis
MRIAIIGPGLMSIPPKGWGAVESLIWDYNVVLKEMGHDVKIINERQPNIILTQINQFNPDVVHIQYDDWVGLVNQIKQPVILTSHFAYLEQPNRHGPYSRFFNQFINSKGYVFALSEGIKETYIKHGKSTDKIFIVPNGVKYDLFDFIETPEDKSIYLAKVDDRKGQYKYHNIPNLYFAGNIVDNKYNKNNWLGEWTKPQLYKNLTNYSNLVLLSDGEAHPLVCMEAMSAGLGLVISEYSIANLDTSLPFIDVIPKEKMGNIEYVRSIIERNRVVSREHRKEIRQYVKDNFDWKKIIENYYIPNIEKIL